MVAHNHLYLQFQEDPIPSSDLYRHQTCMSSTFIHVSKTLIHIKINIYIEEARALAQQFREFVALGLGLNSQYTHGGSQRPPTLVPGDPTLSSDLYRYQAHVIHIRTLRQNIHKNKPI